MAARKVTTHAHVDGADPLPEDPSWDAEERDEEPSSQWAPGEDPDDNSTQHGPRLGVAMTPALAARIDAWREHMHTEHGVRLTRPSAVRAILEHALNEAERKRGKT